MNIRTIPVVIAALLLARQGTATCVAEGPLATARWIYANQNGFPLYQFPQDRQLMRRFLSPRLLGLLEVEWPCQVVSEGSCAVDTDSWTNTQEGEVRAPITFRATSITLLRSTVSMRFRFLRSPGDASQPVPAQATLSLVRDARSGCWLLDDLVGMKGRSLVEQLQSYAAFYP